MKTTRTVLYSADALHVCLRDDHACSSDLTLPQTATTRTYVNGRGLERVVEHPLARLVVIMLEGGVRIRRDGECIVNMEQGRDR